ncbi:hypothetical protein [uncultured Marinobacter sp.]|nr:hypothetical protein [uncultured Marinobacter sp.]
MNPHDPDSFRKAWDSLDVEKDPAIQALDDEIVERVKQKSKEEQGGD